MSQRRHVGAEEVCVFMGSSGGTRPEYLAAAREVGRELAERGLALVYGGGDIGLMGAVARSVHEHGGCRHLEALLLLLLLRGWRQGRGRTRRARQPSTGCVRRVRTSRCIPGASIPTPHPEIGSDIRRLRSGRRRRAGHLALPP
jgi:hypothetical protein